MPKTAIAGREPNRVHLSRARLNRLTIEYVTALRAVLREMCMVNRTPESLRAAEDVEQALNLALIPNDYGTSTEHTGMH